MMKKIVSALTAALIIIASVAGCAQNAADPYCQVCRVFVFMLYASCAFSAFSETCLRISKVVLTMTLSRSSSTDGISSSTTTTDKIEPLAIRRHMAEIISISE